MRRVREGEVPPDGATALQDDPDRPVFRANGPYDYVCVECGNVLAASMGLEQMTKRVRIKCGRCKTINVAGLRRQGRDVSWLRARAAARRTRGFIRGQGRFVDDVHLPRDAARRGAALAVRARGDRLDRRSAALQHPKVHAVLTGRRARRRWRGCRRCRPTRRPCWPANACVFQGQEVAFVDRRRSLLRARRAGADRRRVRAAAGRDRRARGAGRRRHDRSRDGAATTSSTGRPATRAATDAAFARAEVVVEQDMVFPRSHPAPMETCGAIAAYDRVDGKLTLWCTTQAPHAHRTLYSLITGLPEHRIRVISPDVGGGFGNKVPVYPGYVCAMAACDAARAAGQVGRGPLREPDVDRVRARLRDAAGGSRRRATGASWRSTWT